MSELRLRLLRDMVRIRLVEEGIATRYGTQEMRNPVHLSIGQEAAAVGVCAAMEPGDYAFGTHRSHGHYLAKGGRLVPMLAELYGRVGGCCQGKGGSMHLVDMSVGFMGATSIVSSTIPIAAGLAMASAWKMDGKVTCSFLGDASVEEGVFHETANFASLHKLPLVFVCENNLYSVYSGLSVRQPPGRGICDLARGHGMVAKSVDGNDAEKVYDVACDAIAMARGGSGPTLIELKTYRWRTHCGAEYDNDLGYRTEHEFQEWKKRCPIDLLRARLLASGALKDDEYNNMVQSCLKEIDYAFAEAQASPWPTPDQMMVDVYGEGA